MGWSQVVHQNRKQAELSRARQELRLRRRDYDIELEPDARMSSILALVGILSGAVWWRKEGRTVQGRDWHNVPGIQQLLELLNLKPKQPQTTARGKAKPKQSTRAAVMNKAAMSSAARTSSSNQQQQQQQQLQSGQPAAQRQGSSGSQQQQQQQPASSNSSASSKSKKKRNKKRR